MIREKYIDHFLNQIPDKMKGSVSLFIGNKISQQEIEYITDKGFSVISCNKVESENIVATTFNLNEPNKDKSN